MALIVAIAVGLLTLPLATASLGAEGQAKAPRITEVEAFRVGASLLLRAEVQRRKLRPLPTVRLTALGQTVRGVRERLDGGEGLAYRIDFEARIPAMGRSVGDSLRVTVRGCTGRACTRIVRTVEIEPAHDR
jgi:hypothetical protein